MMVYDPELKDIVLHEDGTFRVDLRSINPFPARPTVERDYNVILYAKSNLGDWELVSMSQRRISAIRSFEAFLTNGRISFLPSQPSQFSSEQIAALDIAKEKAIAMGFV